jgi:hypothetical protein
MHLNEPQPHDLKRTVEIVCYRASVHSPSSRPVHVGIDRRLLCRSTVGSFADQPSARSPVTESTIERTNTRLVGPAETYKPHRNTQFTRTSTRRKMNSVLDGDERRGAYAPISWLYFTGLVNIQRRNTGATYRMGSCPPRRPVRHDLQDSLSPA